MPLRAFINNEEKVSILINDEEWNLIKEKLKKGDLKLELPCCKQPGFLRVSSKGLKHFIHAKGQEHCDWKPESPEHLAAKSEIIQACMASGWEAIPEFSENDWRADVLAKKKDHRIAFEIQWSAQTTETTQFRQERYRQSNVRGCWFFRTVPKQFKKSKDESYAIQDVPFFKIKKTDKEKIIVEFDKKEIPVKDFVASLLNKEIKFCKNYRARKLQEVEFKFFTIQCWKCGKAQHLYTIDDLLKSNCNFPMYLMGSMWDDEDLDKHPAIVKAVNEIVAEQPKYKIGQVKNRYSKTVRDCYLSFGCYSCDALFGDFPLAEERREALNNGLTESVKKIIDIGEILNEGAHWCFSAERNFCE